MIRNSLSLGKKLAIDTVATVVGSDLFGFLVAYCRLRLIGADMKVFLCCVQWLRLIGADMKASLGRVKWSGFGRSPHHV